jgi:hypothetical protein
MKKSIIAGAILAVVATLALPTAAMAASYPSTVSANSGAAGSTIVFSASTGQPTGTPAVVSLTGNNALESGSITPASTLTNSNITVGANGALSFNIKLPTTAPAGSTYTLAVSAGSFVAQQTLSVTAAAASSGLAFTGFDAMPYVWFGAGLVVLGAGFFLALFFVRRNRKVVVQA